MQRRDAFDCRKKISPFKSSVTAPSPLGDGIQKGLLIVPHIFLNCNLHSAQRVAKEACASAMQRFYIELFRPQTKGGAKGLD